MNATQLDSTYMMPTFQGIRMGTLTRGEGCRVWGDAGKEYLDFLAGIATVSLGHCHPAVVSALKEQGEKLWHTSNYFINEPAARLASELTKATGMDRAFFSNSGAEANEGAIKLARRYFSSRGIKRWKIITALDSFHGRTLAMVAATGQPKYQAPYTPVPAGFTHVPYGDIAALRAAIDEETAAVLIEPILGEAGVIVPDAGYFPAVRALCDEHGVLMMLDEVQTGMGRTGTLLACQGIGVVPDVVTMAKALANGFPIGAVLARGEAATSFSPGDHGTTFGGNALACAVACAVLDAFQNENILERCRETGAYFLSRLEKLAARHENVVAPPRGRGLMLGLPMLEGCEAKGIVKHLYQRGFITNAAGNNTLRFVPPLTIERADIDALIEALDAELAALTLEEAR